MRIQQAKHNRPKEIGSSLEAPMSAVWKSGKGGEKVVGVTITDVHLSRKPPIARSCEQDWFGVMGGYLEQVRKLCAKYAAPLIIPGDIFDQPAPPIELVNFAIKHLPPCYAVPGQHDLLHHSYDNIHKTAYWTLVEAGVIINLQHNKPKEVGCIRLHGFPWGFELGAPQCEPHDLLIEVAVIHAYVWSKKQSTGYPGAPEDKSVGAYKKCLSGYTLALTGDNHIPFEAGAGECLVYNGGVFMRRKSDEIDHKPRAGLIYSDGSVKSHYLDVSEDKFVEAGTIEKALKGIGAETFIEQLSSLTDAAISFSDAVKRLLEREKASPEVKQMVLGMLDKVK